MSLSSLGIGYRGRRGLTAFETTLLALAAASLVVLAVGGFVAFRRLSSIQAAIERLASEHRVQNEFMRRKASQDAIGNFAFSTLSAELHSTFGYVDLNYPLPLSSVEDVFKKDDAHRQKLIVLLRNYEGLARGINHGIYDEDVVRVALRGSMIGFARAFSIYIADRRTKLANPLLWIELTSLTERWASEDRARPQ
ncbi:MAG: DUF4760 domain-containing protein [Rhodocyclaceae bacterium]|nr:DUF4760 domain-containing protein [Rhodocyclaceae bacterium]